MIVLFHQQYIVIDKQAIKTQLFNEVVFITTPKFTTLAQQAKPQVLQQ